MVYTLEKIKEKTKPIFTRSEVLSAAIFGSYSKGNAKDDSDIDFLVEFPEGKSLFDLIRLKNELEEELGKKVDVTTPDALHPMIKNEVLEEKKEIL